MKTTINTIFAALLLMLTISCEKESGIKSVSVADKGSTVSLLTGTDGAAAVPVVKIGTQKWMIQNLDVSRYRNGDKIPQVKDDTSWATSTTGAWCYLNNDPANGAIYGKLYNWYAMHDPRGLAPEGYHMPTDAEWTTLSTFLGGDYVAGGKMKEAGTTHWADPNWFATNSSGFTGLPGGYRYQTGTFFSSGGFNGYWWMKLIDSNPASPSGHNLYYYTGNLTKFYCSKRYGLSVRCIKD